MGGYLGIGTQVFGAGASARAISQSTPAPTGTSTSAATAAATSAGHPALGASLAAGGLLVAGGSLARLGGTARVVGALAGLATAALGATLLLRSHGSSPAGTGGTTTPLPAPGPSPAAPSGGAVGTTLHVAQLNAHNLFDTVDDPHHSDDLPTPAAQQQHLAKLAHLIADDMHAPDIVTMEEVENQTALDQLLARPELQALGYRGIVLEGTDPRGIDNAVIWRAGSVQLDHAAQLDPRTTSATGRSVHVYTRPPLVATFDVGAVPTAGNVGSGQSGAADAHNGAGQLTVVAAHFTSKLGGAPAAAKRSLQARELGDYTDAFRAANPDGSLIVGGDLNMTDTEPEYAPLVTRADGTSRGMDQVESAIPADTRWSWGRASQRQLLDHVLVSPSLSGSVDGVTINHLNTTSTAAQQRDPDIGAGASDHDPVELTVTVPSARAFASDGNPAAS